MDSQKAPQAVIEKLQSDLHSGLSLTTYEAQLKVSGPNALPAAKRHHGIILFLKSLIEPLAVLLIIVSIISAAIGEYKEMGVILGIVLINAAIGTFQELKSRQSLDALKKLSSPKVTVRRGGQTFEVDTASLVPGDIVLLDAGKFVPADLRILEAAQVQIDESALTGESMPASKTALALAKKPTALGEQLNMAFMSTFLTKGRIVGIVTATGLNTEMGKIAAMLVASPEHKTPLQKRLGKLVRYLSVFALLVGLVIFGWKMGLGDEATTALIAGIAIAVAVVPESLPLIVSVILAFGVNRMAKQKAIIKKLPVVEVLGAVNVVCSDKTGTITQNRMSIVRYLMSNALVPRETLRLEINTEHFINAMALCNDASIDQSGNVLGDPTEYAFIDYLAALNIDLAPIRKALVRVDEAPFDSDRKLMSTVHQNAKGYTVYTKGALDILIQRCTKMILNGEVVPIKPHVKTLLAQAELMAHDALRVLGFAYKHIDQLESAALNYERELIFVGATGMIDPVRPEVYDAIMQANLAGIKTVMITGDHRSTASAIARDLKMIDSESQIISGAELDAMDDETLHAKVNDYRVFSRVSPTHKVRIVSALKAQNLIVAMTGDGVNDGPSLQRADVGIAMGITGTDVAKEAAGMILVDDNFSTIISAVSEGRNIYQKIKRAITFVLSTNFSEVLAVILVLAIAGVQMLSSIQVLWINLLVESIIAIPLGLDVSDKSLMKMPPRSSRERLLKNMMWRIIVISLVTAGVVLAAFFIGQMTNTLTAQTMSFFVMSGAPVLTALALRSERATLFTKAMLGNKKLLLAMALGFGLNFLIIFTPPIASNIGLGTLSDIQIGIAFALMFGPLLTLELIKFLWPWVSQKRPTRRASKT